MAEETLKKTNPFIMRGKAACKEIGVSFMALSMDAKIIVCIVLLVLAVAIFCGGSGSDGMGSREDLSAGSMLSDAGKSIKESYQQGLRDVKNDAEINKDIEEIRKQSKKVGEAAGQLKDAIKGLSF